MCSCGNVHSHTGGGFSEVCRVLISGGAKVEHRVPEPKDSIYVQCSFCLKMAAHKVHAHMRTNAPRHTRTHAHTCVHTLTHAHTHARTHSHTHAHKHTYRTHQLRAQGARTHEIKNAHTHTHTHARACATHAHTHTHAHTTTLPQKSSVLAGVFYKRDTGISGAYPLLLARKSRSKIATQIYGCFQQSFRKIGLFSSRVPFIVASA